MRSTVPATNSLRSTSFADRHRAARDAVVSSQRGRLIESIVGAVCEKGYAATTLADIVGRARVSRTTFYEHFTNKVHCFHEALQAGADILTERVAEEIDRTGVSEPRAIVETVITTYCNTLAAEPEWTQVIMVDAFKVDEQAVAIRDTVVDMHADMYRAFHRLARAENPDIRELSDEVFQLIPDAIGEHTRRMITKGGLAELPTAAPMFVEFTLHVLGI